MAFTVKRSSVWLAARRLALQQVVGERNRQIEIDEQIVNPVAAELRNEPVISLGSRQKERAVEHLVERENLPVRRLIGIARIRGLPSGRACASGQTKAKRRDKLPV